VIRLWNRVGPFRVLALLLLLGALGGGALVATDRPVKRPTTASSSTAVGSTAVDTDREDQKQLAEIEAERAATERAARDDAQRKADEAAVAAAEQAKAVATPSATKSKAPKSSTSAAPPKSNLPIPTSCAQYSGVKATGCAVLLSLGLGLDQFPCVDKLFTRESGWNYKARNPSTGAGGIPQALPPSKMAS